MASIDSLYAASAIHAPLTASPVDALYATAAKQGHEGGELGGTKREGNTGNGYYQSAVGQAGLQNAGQQYSNFSQMSGISQSDPNFLNAFNKYHVAQTNASQGGFLDNALAKFLPAATVGLATAGIGSAVAAPLVGTVGATAAGAIGGLAQGAIAGAGTGVLTGGNIGKSALIGGVGGGIAGGIGASGVGSSASKSVSDATGVNSTVANGLVKTGIGAVKGAATGALSGQGALQGAAGGALSAGTNAVSGSILSGIGSIFNSGQTVLPSTNPSLTNPGNPSMSDDYDANNYIDFSDPSNPGYNPGFDNLDVAGGGSTLGGGYDTSGGSSGQSGSSAGGSALSSLLKALTGGGGANSPGISSLLSQLINGGAGAVNHGAAVSAGQNYANQTKYNPYNVSNAGGSASFNGTNASSSLSPGDQSTYNGLQGLAGSSAAALQAGPGAAASQYYNQLQASQADANNKYYQNNLDNQMASGVLSSTAGQYQSQAALANITNQGLQDQTLANNFANTQQQNQLSQLTGSLNGMQGINSNQNSLLQLGGNLGNQASGNNLQAYKPLAGANSNSALGSILSSIGQTAANNQSH